MKYMRGDILTPATNGGKTVVCHQVNCMGVMGGGLARQVRDKFPAVYEEYRQRCMNTTDKKHNLGLVLYSYAPLSTHGFIIANLFGQYEYGVTRRHTDYNALTVALADVSRRYQDCTIRIPYKIGCGLGGGDWDMVTSVIASQLGFLGDKVEIWRR